jgi:NAD-dependent SIR2 family protein deacetylase
MLDLINQAKALIQSADGMRITAVAGMGVDSGLPDFRGNTGMWEHYPALGSVTSPIPLPFRGSPA